MALGSSKAAMTTKIDNKRVWKLLSLCRANGLEWVWMRRAAMQRKSIVTCLATRTCIKVVARHMNNVRLVKNSTSLQIREKGKGKKESLKKCLQNDDFIKENKE